VRLCRIRLLFPYVGAISNLGCRQTLRPGYQRAQRLQLTTDLDCHAYDDPLSPEVITPWSVSTSHSHIKSVRCGSL
jgi:hypothetical protein